MGIFDFLKNLFNSSKGGSTYSSGNYQPKASTIKQKSIQTIEEVLNTEFYSYEIKKGISATIFGPQYDFCQPFSYGLYRGDQLVAVVMLVDHNKDKNRAYLTSKSLCENNGIPFVNFYTHMRNERQYVLERIEKGIA